MQGIGVLLKNGGWRPPMATFSHKGRRKGNSLNIRFNQNSSRFRAKGSTCGQFDLTEAWIDSKLTNLFHRAGRATMGAGKETWTTSLSSAPALVG